MFGKVIHFSWPKKGLRLLLALVMIGFLSACSANDHNQEGSFEVQEQGSNQAERGAEKGRTAGTEEEALRAKEIAYSVDGVSDVAAVCIGKELSLAADVRQMKRFQLKAIRKEIFHKLRHEFPEHEIHVTTDRKLLRDLKELEQVPYPYGKKERDRLSKINEDMKG